MTKAPLLTILSIQINHCYDSMKTPSISSRSACALTLALLMAAELSNAEDALDTARRIIDAAGGAARAYQQAQRAGQGRRPNPTLPPPSRPRPMNPPPSAGVDILIAEKPYDAARLIKKENGIITIIHKTGIAKFKIADLSEDDRSVLSLVFDVKLDAGTSEPEATEKQTAAADGPSSARTTTQKGNTGLEQAAASGDARSAVGGDTKVGVSASTKTVTGGQPVPSAGSSTANKKEEEDCFGGKTLPGGKKSGPAVKGMQLGMHVTEARDALTAQWGETLAMKFRVVEYDDGYGIRGTRTATGGDGNVSEVLDKLSALSANMILSAAGDMEKALGGGNNYRPGADEIYVLAGKDGIVKAIGFPPLIVRKLFGEVNDLPIAQFTEQFAAAYHVPFMKLSFDEESQPNYQSVTSDGVVVVVSQRLETMKAITIDRKDIRGSKGFN